MKSQNLPVLILVMVLMLSFGLDAQDETMLYKIEKEGIETSYLYGTIHLLPKEDFELKDPVKAAFKDSDLIVLELDMDDPAMQANMMKQAILPGSLSLDSILTEKEFELLDNEMKAMGAGGLAMYNKMKPFVITQLILTNMLGEAPASFEFTFVEMAKAQEKEILGFETVEAQLALFDSIPYRDQMEDILEMLTEKEETMTTFSEMVEFYKKGDTNGLLVMFNEYFDEEGEKDLLLDQRNRNWIPQVANFSAAQSVFYGVGAGHLGGDQGVINLLREAGYTVSPINWN